jgi:DNA-binding NtrC family response regulator
MSTPLPIWKPPAGCTHPPDDEPRDAVVYDVTRKLTQRALDRTGGHPDQAARSLGIPRGTLRYTLKKCGLAGT